MTPCEKLGYKFGDVFTHKLLGKVKVSLFKDDGTPAPLFKVCSSGEIKYLRLSYLTKFTTFKGNV